MPIPSFGYSLTGKNMCTNFVYMLSLRVELWQLQFLCSCNYAKSVHGPWFIPSHGGHVELELVTEYLFNVTVWGKPSFVLHQTFVIISIIIIFNSASDADILLDMWRHTLRSTPFKCLFHWQVSTVRIFFSCLLLEAPGSSSPSNKASHVKGMCCMRISS